MANMDKSAYQDKDLSPTPDFQLSQGRATAERSGHGDPRLLRPNEPPIPVDRKLGGGVNSSAGKANNTGM